MVGVVTALTTEREGLVLSMVKGLIVKGTLMLLELSVTYKGAVDVDPIIKIRYVIVARSAD